MRRFWGRGGYCFGGSVVAIRRHPLFAEAVVAGHAGVGAGEYTGDN